MFPQHSPMTVYGYQISTALHNKIDSLEKHTIKTTSLCKWFSKCSKAHKNVEPSSECNIESEGFPYGRKTYSGRIIQYLKHK